MYGLVFAVLAIAVVSESLPAVPCIPGETKTDQTQSCVCLPDGSDYACTRNTRSIVKAACTPGESFQWFCNTCHCGTDGVRENAACTRKGCATGIWNEDGTLVNPTPQNGGTELRTKRQTDRTCVIGSTKMNACNSCQCTGDPPVWACTKIACD